MSCCNHHKPKDPKKLPKKLDLYILGAIAIFAAGAYIWAAVGGHLPK